MKFPVCKGLLLGLSLMPGMAFASEPVPQLTQFFSGSMFIASSVMTLLWVILIKAGAFALIERSIRWYQGILLMVLAGLFSSLIGFLLGLANEMPISLVVIVPVIFWFSLTPARRLVEEYHSSLLGLKSPVLISLVLVLLFVLSWGLFELAGAIPRRETVFMNVWLLKLAYVCGALAIGVFLSSLWEEWIVSGFGANPENEGRVLSSVIQANVVSLIILMLYAGVMMMPLSFKPERLLVLN